MELHLIHILRCIKLSQAILCLIFTSKDKIFPKEDRIQDRFLKGIFPKIEVHLIIKTLVREIIPIMFKWHLNTSNINKLRVKERQF